jgi:hypothetical protein
VTISAASAASKITGTRVSRVPVFLKKTTVLADAVISRLAWRCLGTKVTRRELFAGLCSFFLLVIRPEALTLTSTGTAEISE